MPIVPKERALWFFIVFVLQFLGCLGLVVYQEVVDNTGDTALETAIAVGEGLAPFVIINIVMTVVIVEGAAMLYDLYKREVKERTKKETTEENRAETLRLSQEWEKLSPEEQKEKGITEYLRNKWTKPEEQ